MGVGLRPRRRTILVGLVGVGGLLLSARPVFAGGGPETTLVVVDPRDADSLYLANYYVAARQIPATNVVYLAQSSANYSTFVNAELEAVLGELANRGLDGRAAYVVLATGLLFRVPASGYVTDADACTGITKFSLSSVYTHAFLANAILGGSAGNDYGLTSAEPNQYFSVTDSGVAFDGGTRWWNGNPSGFVGAPKYFIGAMLGYTGLRGNTPGEIVTMIDRSVAADGSRPGGTFYYMETTDSARSDPRDGFFDDAVTSITALGGQAVHWYAVLPTGQHDCLGIMTGWASPAIATTNMTLLNGAFCDHLTSWAATFDKSAQTKVSAWIAKGASGSHGTVEEPCAVAAKFPHPRMHVYYYQGLSLGESVFRSLEAMPFQGLVYGDPLTQPFAYLPTVDVPGAPSGTVSGVLTLSPDATTPAPTATIAKLELFIDGEPWGTREPGESFVLDTADLPDGQHEFRIVAYDDSPVASQGRWVRLLRTDNRGQSVTLDVTPPAGDLSTEFALAVSAGGGPVVEVRVLQNGRVVAATANATDTLPLSGTMLGAGPVSLIAEAEFDDGSLAYSDVATVGIDLGGACCLIDGACRPLPETACTQHCGAVFVGEGTSCNPGPCSACGTGDFTTDGSVDLVDFGFVQECFSGDGVPPPDDPPGRQADCLCAFDTDSDNDVDLSDHQAFVEQLTGPCLQAPNTAPIAFGYTNWLRGHEPSIVELPATDADGDQISYTIVSPPAQGSASLHGAAVILRPGSLATGLDSCEFEVYDGLAASLPATVWLRYPDPPPSVSVQVGVVGAPSIAATFTPPDVNGRVGRLAPFSAWFANDGSTLTLNAPAMQWVSPFARWVVDGSVKPLSQTQTTAPLDHNVIAVATYRARRPLAVRANRPSVSITQPPPWDDNGQGSGITPYDRVYTVDATNVLLIAPSSSGGYPLRYWKLDGVSKTPGTTFLTVPAMDDQHLAVAVYANIPGDFEDDGDMDSQDFAAFQTCFSGDFGEPGFVPPSPECLAAFDLEAPADGDVDLADLAVAVDNLTGPF